MRQWTRPDGRCFVFGEPDGDLPPGRAYATADEGDKTRVGTLARLGFGVQRRELVLELPTDVAAAEIETPVYRSAPAVRSAGDPAAVREAVRLLEAAQAYRPDLALWLWLPLVTGTRRGELCAIRWSDIDFAISTG